MSNLDWVDDLKVVELRKKLKELGENTTGKKSVLAERLKGALVEKEEEAQEASAEDQPDEQEAAEKPEAEEEKMDVDQPEDDKDALPVVGEPSIQTADQEKEEIKSKSVKGGLNELLGDGKDDLELDFETDKPVRKKQKLEEREEKTEDVVDPSAAIATGVTEKKTQEDDIVDFDTPQQEEGDRAQEEIVKVASDAMEIDTPVVPEEDRTCALKIQNFVRPFTEKAAKEMLSAYGTVEDMWMPPIKTHCFVIFDTSSTAHDAYQGTYHLVWPKSGKQLLPSFVSIEEAKGAIEEGRSKALYARASGSSSYQKKGPTNAPPARTNSEETGTRQSRAGTKPALSLEDLFFKTQAKPPIYYLPLTDEQVAERKQSAKEKEAEGVTQEEKNG